MRQLALFLVGIGLLGSQKAWGHGFQVHVDGSNKLQVTSIDPHAGSNPYYAVETLTGSTTPRSTIHPGFEPTGGFTDTAKVYFDVLGPLWFSPGSGTPTADPNGVALSILSQDLGIGGSLSLSGLTGSQNGFLIGEYDGGLLGVEGAEEHQLFYQLTKAGGVPPGAYAVGLQLRGTNGSGQPYVPSAPLVAIFNIGLNTTTTLPAVASQLYTVAIPEPSAQALAWMGSTLLVIGRGWRCRRARRTSAA
jgi:hypothetical protein